MNNQGNSVLCQKLYTPVVQSVLTQPPQQYCSIATPAGEYASIRAERHTPNSVSMSSECGYVYTGICVPYLDGAFFMSAGEYASIWTECHAENTLRTASKGILVFTSICIPESDSAVAASTGIGLTQ